MKDGVASARLCPCHLRSSLSNKTWMPDAMGLFSIQQSRTRMPGMMSE